MQENSTYKFCMSACIFMILVSLSMNLVSILNVFGTNTPSPIINQTTSNATTVAGGDILSLLGTNIIGIFTGGILAVGGLILVVALAGRTGSWNIVAAYLFGLVFWASWLANITVFKQGEFFSSPVMASVYLMITVVMVFIFAGATIGILGGTE